MDIRHQHRPLSLYWGSPRYFVKVIMEYGLQIRNNGYSGNAVSIGRSTEKIKDCLSIFVSKGRKLQMCPKTGHWQSSF